MLATHSHLSNHLSSFHLLLSCATAPHRDPLVKMPHGDLLDLAEKPKGRDRLTLQKMAREHAMAVIRDYSAQPRMGA